MKINKLIRFFGFTIPSITFAAVILTSCSSASNPYASLKTNDSYTVENSSQANQLLEIAKDHLPIVSNSLINIDDINSQINNTNLEYVYWDLTAAIMQSLKDNFHNVSLSLYEPKAEQNETNKLLINALSINIQEEFSANNIACKISYIKADKIYLQIEENNQEIFRIISYQYQDAIIN